MATDDFCELCSLLYDRKFSTGNDPLGLEVTIDDLKRYSQRCSGPCETFHAGILHIASVAAQQATKHVLLGGGRTSNSYFRIHGADEDYQETFKIEFFTDKEYTDWPWNLLMRGPILPFRSNDRKCVEQLQRWLQTCRNEHSMCRVSAPIPNTKIRILDIDDGRVRLVEGFEVCNTFAALSHCWGDGKHIISNQQSIPSHKRGIAIADLPKTFKDAVNVCTYLHLRYLWIDSLCIIQDDRKDWEVEASKMSSVYQYAKVVLAASAASNSSEGLFWSRQQPFQFHPSSAERSGTPLTVFARKAIEHTHYTVSGSEDSERDPLSTRAWCLQEWLLARRLVHFSASELVWDCRQGASCECGGLDMRRRSPAALSSEDTRVLRGQISKVLTRLQTVTISVGELTRLWKNVVEEYTARNMTKQTDRMVAVSGLAAELARHAGLGDYVCGLFTQGLVSQLLWNRRDDTLPSPRPERPMAPSWSWGSISEPVEWLDIWPSSSVSGRDCTTVDCAEIHIEKDGQGRFSDAVESTLQLRTQCLHGTIKAKSILEFGACLTTVRACPGGEEHEVFFTLDIDLSPLIAASDLQVKFVKMVVFKHDKSTKEDRGDDEAELLCGSLVVLASQTNQQHYMRIGVVLGDVQAEWYDRAEEHVICVI